MKKYSQIVKHPGNIPLFDILNVSTIGALTGIPIHVHVEGLRGTGKTTIMRAYKEILPEINRIKGCLYNCNPSKPHCPEHCNLTSKEIDKIGIEKIKMPFLEISPSAKKGTVVGSIDLQKLSSKSHPEAALLVGTIPKAHRGVVFIDEINRIADTSPEIVDLLLDVMGTKPGRIQIEEAGLPVTEVPAQVNVWAASNPDEDPGSLENIRRQLSDRFDFTVNVERPKDVFVINRIFSNGIPTNNNNLVKKKTMKLIEAGNNTDQFEPTKKIKEIFSSIYVNHNIESLRSIEAALLGIKIRSALLGREPNVEDVIFITRYALRHRVSMKDLSNILKDLESKKDIARDIPNNIKIPVQQENKVSFSSKTIKNNANRDNETEDQKPGFLRNFLRKIIRGSKLKGSGKTKNNKISNQKVENIKAPPNKAISIDHLRPTEYVKTEKDLI